MDKRGSVLFYVLMMGVVVMLLALAFAPALKQVTDEATNSEQLNCSNSSLSDQDKAVCTSTDMQQFLFVGTLIGLAGLLWASMAGGGM